MRYNTSSIRVIAHPVGALFVVIKTVKHMTAGKVVAVAS